MLDFIETERQIQLITRALVVRSGGFAYFLGTSVALHSHYMEESLRCLSPSTRAAVVQSLEANSENKSVYEFIAYLLQRHTTGPPLASLRGNAKDDNIIYYGVRLAETLIAFGPTDHTRNKTCADIATALEQSARDFHGADDTRYRSGTIEAENEMNARAAWYCLGVIKIESAETLEFMITNLDSLKPHVKEIRKRSYYDVKLLSSFLASPSA